MSIWSILLIGIGLSMDAFAVSVTNGIVTRGLNWKITLRIALSFGIFQALMPIIGYFAGIYFSGIIESFSGWVTFALLAFIGIKMIVESVRNRDSCESGVERDPISFKMLLMLSIATSIDALAVGVSFALVRTNIWLAASLIGIVTLIICTIGVRLGKRFGCLFSQKAEIFGGIILIAIGVKILLESLLG